MSILRQFYCKLRVSKILGRKFLLWKPQKLERSLSCGNNLHMGNKLGAGSLWQTCHLRGETDPS